MSGSNNDSENEQTRLFEKIPPPQRRSFENPRKSWENRGSRSSNDWATSSTKNDKDSWVTAGVDENNAPTGDNWATRTARVPARSSVQRPAPKMPPPSGYQNARRSFQDDNFKAEESKRDSWAEESRISNGISAPSDLGKSRDDDSPPPLNGGVDEEADFEVEKSFQADMNADEDTEDSEVVHKHFDPLDKTTRGGSSLTTAESSPDGVDDKKLMNFEYTGGMAKELREAHELQQRTETLNIDDEDSRRNDGIDDDECSIESEELKDDTKLRLPSTEALSFLHVAHPHGARTNHVQCLIVREKSKGLAKKGTTYQLILEDTKKCMILAKKMAMNKTSNYHLFDMTRGLVNENLTKKSGNYLGKLRAVNTSRTKYVLVGKASEREEIAGISFDRNSMYNQISEGSQPRKLQALLPALDSNGVPIPHKTTSEAESMHDKEASDKSQFFRLTTKEPTFENGNYRLNFKGRVSVPSVKNFQLISPDSPDDIICQFGKVGDDRFHLDYKEPLNAMQALALALCQFNL
jgi:tubby-related protein 1